MSDPQESQESKSLRDEIDLDAWEPESPPSGFAERVQRTMTETSANRPKVLRSKIARRIGAIVMVAACAAASVGVARNWTARSASGDVIAKDRVEVPFGRGIAVLERGAEISWNGDVVLQPTGDVFYRVERGETFRVKTPAGDVEVRGTCFRVRVEPSGSRSKDAEKEPGMKRDLKSGAIGAALAATAFVSVYEGKVAVSHAMDSVTLTAGESARADGHGVSKIGDSKSSQNADGSSASGAGDEALMAANQNLVGSVDDYKRKLEALDAEKHAVEARLADAEKKLAATDAQALGKNEFDLSRDEWADLAKDGTVKYRLPCMQAKGWLPGSGDLETLGLAPSDAPAIQNAYKQSTSRLLAVVMPLCAQAVGSMEVAQRIGADSCIHVIVDAERATNRAAADQAMYDVGLIRSGQEAPPAPGANVDPVLALFLAMTDSTPEFEKDLAQTFGPDEAHRLAYANGMCAGTHSFGGPGRRAP